LTDTEKSTQLALSHFPSNVSASDLDSLSLGDLGSAACISIPLRLDLVVLSAPDYTFSQFCYSPTA
jgi:hypothetical protein